MVQMVLLKYHLYHFYQSEKSSQQFTTDFLIFPIDFLLNYV